MNRRAEFRELSADDRANGVNLTADVIDVATGRRVAVVKRLAPSPKEDRFGDHSERRFVCSCWRAEGVVAVRENCADIQCVEAAIAAAARPA